MRRTDLQTLIDSRPWDMRLGLGAAAGTSTGGRRIVACCDSGFSLIWTSVKPLSWSRKPKLEECSNKLSLIAPQTAGALSRIELCWSRPRDCTVDL